MSKVFFDLLLLLLLLLLLTDLGLQSGYYVLFRNTDEEVQNAMKKGSFVFRLFICFVSFSHAKEIQNFYGSKQGKAFLVMHSPMIPRMIFILSPVLM
jgi:hypothetical protein